MSVIELREHAPAAVLPLDATIGRALADGGYVKASPDPHVPGNWRLAAGSMVGAFTVAAPGHAPVTVRVVPKMSIGRLFFLLGYAIKPKGWREDQVEVAEHQGLLPALAHAFERQAERALRQGLLQGYRVTQESAMVVRGRIREGEQIRRRYGLSIPVELEYDEYTADIPENQVLRAGVERLLRLPGVPAGVRARLLHQRARLSEVTVPGRGHLLPRWSPTRLNARYHHALHLAEIVLRGASVEHLTGAVRIEGFVFDMNKVFEDFVTVALREALTAADPFAQETGAGGRAVLQDRHFLDEDSTVLMKPDLVWYDHTDRPAAVADAKYKAEKPNGFPGADLYQLLAYCTVLGLGEGHLIYAKGHAAHACHLVRNTGIWIHQHALDLEQDPERLLADIGQIAAALARPRRSGRS
jgi:5-methylcytosine-specific restriction enzyme subunit McrC